MDVPILPDTASSLDVPVPVNEASATEPIVSSPPARLTTSQSEEYCHRLADVFARASRTEPVSHVFIREMQGSEVEITTRVMYDFVRARLARKIPGASVIAEANDFAAVACWDKAPSYLSDEFLLAHEASRPAFVSFVRQHQAASRACFGGEEQEFWQLSLMARDPARNDKGVVRAVIEGYTTLAKREKMPIWLVAGSAHARNIYEYFGFKVVSTNEFGANDVERICTWNMVFNWPIEPLS